METVDNKVEKQFNDSVLCPWCKTYYETRPGTNCLNCGGALPPPPGPDRGDKPPATPRMFPKGYKWRILTANNWRMYIGAVIFFFTFPTSLTAIIFQLPFYGIGAMLIWHGYYKARQKLDILEHGKTAEGLIVEAGENETMSVNEKHPYFIKYEYDVDGRKYTGSMNCFDEFATSFKAGDMVWVVYLPGNLQDKSSLWPPVA
jgi:hypothetical protein